MTASEIEAFKEDLEKQEDLLNQAEAMLAACPDDDLARLVAHNRSRLQDLWHRLSMFGSGAVN